jgi:CheY-like chemotaxis protein
MQQAKSRPLRVLVVDDEPDSARSLAMLVGLWGHEAHTALSGVDAVVGAVDFQPDVVLCDLQMPRVDGCKVAENLRRNPRLAGTLLVAVTAYGDADHRRRAAGAGFHAHMVKPVDADGLHRLLDWQSKNL